MCIALVDLLWLACLGCLVSSVTAANNAAATSELHQEVDKKKRVSSRTEQTIPNTPAGLVLAKWLKAHNRADRAALSKWMKKSFSEELLSKMDFEKHLDWYFESTRMFGKLQPKPYSIVENKPNRLVVQFLSVDIADKNQVDPTKVIIVKVDMDPTDPEFLKRGLGIGPLACETRR